MPRAEGKPQSYDEIVEQGITKRATSRVFSTKSSDENDIRLSELVTASVDELAKAAEAMDSISLSDSSTVKARTLLYVRACADAGNLPTFSGLMRSMGMSAEAGYAYKRRNPDSATGRWLEMYQDYCGDLLADAALKGMTHPVFSIFVEKSRNLWRDTITVEQVQHNPLGPTLSEEELRERLAKYIELDDFDMPD